MVQYTREDFTDGTGPYEYIYKFENDGFRKTRELEKMAVIAQKCGFRNFKKAYGEYVKNLKKQTSTISSGNVTQFEGQELELECGQWRADDFGVTIDTAFGEAEACNHPILPVLRLVNVDTGVEKLRLAYRKGKQWRYATADKKTLASNNSILDLANVGIAVNSENAKYLVRYLHDMEALNYNAIPEKNSVSRLGWIDGEGFAPYLEDLVFDAHIGYKDIFDSIKSKGTVKDWKDTALAARTMSIAARISLATSFASALIHPLGSLPFFLHLWGGTESGKTVGLMLAVSVWANPQKGKYWHTFDGTQVGNEKTAGFLNSLPLAIDELQIVSDKKSFDKMVYCLSEGIGRTRGAKDGGIQRLETWSNAIITTGEMPLTGMFSGGGAVNRILEIECKEKLFLNAKKVASEVRQNYGWAGKIFVEKLQESDAIQKASLLFDGFYSSIVDGETTEKQAGAAALILTADALATEWIFQDGRALKATEISEFLKTKTEVSVHERAYGYICEYAVQNRNKFDGDSTQGDVWGVLESGVICIVRREFDRICNEAGFNPQALLSWMKQHGHIETGSKGMTKAKRINGYPCHCVVIKIGKEDENFDKIPD